MQVYSISNKKKSKWKKSIVIIIVILGIVFIGISAVGIIAGSDSAENRNISAAVAENVQLKQQIEELNMQISELEAQIDGLNADLSARPTIEPTPYAPMQSTDPRNF